VDEAIVALFVILLRRFSGRTKEKKKILIRGGRDPRQDSICRVQSIQQALHA